MKKAIIITDAYLPEIRSSTKLVYDLVNFLNKKEIHTEIFTFHNKKSYKKTNKLQNIHYINLNNYRDKNFIIRGIKTFLLPFLLYKYINNRKKLFKKRSEKIEFIYLYSPPTTLGFVAVWLKKILVTKLIVNVQDIFPENAKDLGIIKNKFVYQIFLSISKYLYKKSDKLIVHSYGNYEYLIKKYYTYTFKKIIVSNNWYTIENNKNPNFKNDIFKFDKKIIVFSGIMGPSQDYDNFIRLNEQNGIRDRFNFLIISEGKEIDNFKSKVKELNFNNFFFMGFVHDDQLRSILKKCQYGIISLSFKNKTPVVPGKLMIYSACSLPVIGIINKESDLNKIIKKYHSGLLLNHKLQNPFLELSRNILTINEYEYLNFVKNTDVLYKEEYESNKVLKSLFNNIGITF